MSTRLKEKLERLEQLLTKLAEETAKGTPIAVEGKKDAQALRELGVNGTIITVKTGGKSFLKASLEIEKLGVSTTILMLDFDRRGKQGTARLKKDLERARIRADTRFWRELQALTGREIQCVESLPTYMCTLQQKVQ